MALSALFTVHWKPWLWSVALLAGAAILAMVVNRLLFLLANRITKQSQNSVGGAIARYGENPARLILVLSLTLAVLPMLPLPESLAHGAEHAVSLGLIGCIGWMLIAVVQVFDDIVAIRHHDDIGLNLAARR